MTPSIQTITLSQLLLTFIPVGLVIAIMWRWGMSYKTTLYGMLRMLVQLLLVGYFLVYIFSAQSYPVVLAVLMIMLLAASWISLRTISAKSLRLSLLLKAFMAIFISSIAVLLLVTQGVLQLSPWYAPQYTIPLAGMIFSYAMNSISLAAERLAADLNRGDDFIVARNTAFEAAIIPMVNALFAVGLVSLPGMMTGQILAGVSPFIAARYQIMVMCMLFAATGIASALFLRFTEKEFKAAFPPR